MNGADHAFAQSDLPEIIEKINKKNSNIKAIHSTLSNYIHDVREYHKNNSVPLQRVSGELRDTREACILTGSQSTRSDVKIINNKVEGLLERWMEPFTSISWLLGYTYPGEEIKKSWEYLLENHSHDSIACSSVDSTYRQVITRFEWAEELAKDIVVDSLKRICRQISQGSHQEKMIVIFNPLCWERNEIFTTEFDIPKALNIKYPKLLFNEKDIPIVIHNITETDAIKYNPLMGMLDVIPVNRYKISIRLNNVPEIGYKALKIVDDNKSVSIKSNLTSLCNVIENDYMRIEFNPDGTFNIYDKINDYSYRSMHYFEDCGEAGDGFRHEKPQIDQTISSKGTDANIAVIENNPLRITYKIDIKLELPESLNENKCIRKANTAFCYISSLITFTDGCPRIDIHTNIKNSTKDHRLRVVFPTNINTEFSFAEQPFDVVKRKNQASGF